MSIKIQMIKKDNRFRYKSTKDELLYTKFKDQTKEDDVIDTYFEVVKNDSSYLQIKKCHVLFRVISEHSGYTVEEVKMLVKEYCGFAYSKTINDKNYVIPLKSIGDMSKDELISLIECTIRFAQEFYDLILE